MIRRLPASATALVTMLILTLPSCDREAVADDPPAAAAAPVDSPLATTGSDEELGVQPDEIYFDLTAFPWYREGRPLVHNGRQYMPAGNPAPADVELREAGSFEGVTYYVAADAPDPVYTIYVPVYYRYWQRFTAPPGR